MKDFKEVMLNSNGKDQFQIKIENVADEYKIKNPRFSHAIQANIAVIMGDNTCVFVEYKNNGELGDVISSKKLSEIF